jgi:hypothetical protein
VGRELARHLHSRGYNLVLVDEEAHELENLRRQLLSENADSSAQSKIASAGHINTVAVLPREIATLQWLPTTATLRSVVAAGNKYIVVPTVRLGGSAVKRGACWLSDNIYGVALRKHAQTRQSSIGSCAADTSAPQPMTSPPSKGSVCTIVTDFANTSAPEGVLAEMRRVGLDANKVPNVTSSHTSWLTNTPAVLNGDRWKCWCTLPSASPPDRCSTSLCRACAIRCSPTPTSPRCSLGCCYRECSTVPEQEVPAGLETHHMEVQQVCGGAAGCCSCRLYVPIGRRRRIVCSLPPRRSSPPLRR